MVIDTIPNVTVSMIQTRNYNIMAMDSATIASSTASDQEPTDMLHALHHDEKELRILAVVLSLTGGLVLSFLLGVGIFVYWHCRAWRTRRRKKYLKSKKHQGSVKTAALESILSSSPRSSSSSSSPMPSPSSSTSSLSFASHSEASSLAIEAVNDNRINPRQRENPSCCTPPNPITLSSLSSTSSSSTTVSQRLLPSPTAATSSSISTSPHATSTPVPSNISVCSGNNHIDTSSHTISNTSSSDITKRDMLMNNDSAIYRPSPIITSYRSECSSSTTPPMIPPLLLGPTSSSGPIPTAPPAKECLDSPSPSSSIPLISSQDMSNGPSFDPPDIPPPAYSPN